ncbi:MAG TPA: pyridoxal phosphate-dependent aminotransferase [Anaerolineales bacterium]|nr:pyridoxal phosphate-dependent aminotransferase [Anaerolineales bacterium]
MGFANRVLNLQAEGAYAVLARAQELEAQGREILHLEIGQPDFQTFPHISERGIQAIRDGQTRYNPPGGLPGLRQAIAADAGVRRGMEFSPAQVVVGPGAKPGLFFPTLALVEPGDEVIYPDPGFPTYAAMIEIAGGVPAPVSLVEENNFSFDLHAFDERLSKRTKMIILNSPANPTGGVMPLADLEHIADAAQTYDCWVISDEIYARLTYDKHPAPSIACLPGMRERTILVDGFSKTYAMTGWRLGFGIMPEALAERVELLLTHSVGCTATFTQVAGIEALTGDQEMVDQVAVEYQRRRDRIVAGLNAIPGVRCQAPLGAFYAFPNIKSFGLSSRQMAARLLDEAGMAVLAGTDFGPGGEGYLRLCYATSHEIIDRALERMGDFLGSL